MRLIPVLLLALVLAFAGCAKKNDTGGDTPSTTSSPTTSSTTSSSSSSTTTTSPTNNVTTTPTTVMPMELCKPSIDYSAAQPDQATPGNFLPQKKACGPVGAGYTTITLTGNFTSTAPVDVSSGIDLKIVGPDGKTAVASCRATAGTASPEKCSGSGSLLGPGDYSYIGDGGGAVKFDGSVMIS